MPDNRFRLFVSAATWKKDSHGLFDSESSAMGKCECALTPNSILARSVHGDIAIIQPGEILNPNYTPLFKLLTITPRILSFNRCRKLDIRGLY